MSFVGTFVNGKVVLDGSPRLPEGARDLVRLSPEDDELDAELANMPIPPETETHEEFLESLRQSIAEIEAGIPHEECMRRISEELGLPDVPHICEAE